MRGTVEGEQYLALGAAGSFMSTIALGEVRIRLCSGTPHALWVESRVQVISCPSRAFDLLLGTPFMTDLHAKLDFEDALLRLRAEKD